MAHSTALSHSHATPREPALESHKAGKDSGPWLALLGPVLIALTLVTVSWLSIVSFR